MKKLFVLALLALVVVCISFMPQSEVVSKGVLKIQTAWAEGYSASFSFPEQPIDQ